MYIALLFSLAFLAASKAAVQGAVAKKMRTTTDNLLFNSLMFTAIVIVFIAIFGFKIPSLYTFICAAVFGACSVVFQFTYTNALKYGPMSLTVFINSFHLVIPIMVSAFLYKEIPGINQYIGLVFLVASLYMIIVKKESGASESALNMKWLVSIIFCTICAGCTVSSQKVHQYSEFKGEYSQFIVFAYLVASVLSFISYLYFKYSRKEQQHLKLEPKIIYFAALIGVILGIYNSGVLYLSGVFKSVLLTPTINISTVLFSTLYGAVLFHERISKNQKIGFALGLISILLISI